MIQELLAIWYSLFVSQDTVKDASSEDTPPAICPTSGVYYVGMQSAPDIMILCLGFKRCSDALMTSTKNWIDPPSA